MKIVDLETAKTARGLRLGTAQGIPSPWSEAAKSIFRMAGVDFVVWQTSAWDKETKVWTRVRNAPVAMFDDEPARDGWQEILALAERLTKRPLLPTDTASRVPFLGHAAELMGEGGVLWNGRLMMIHAGLAGAENTGFPQMVAQYLAPRYGYAPELMDRARARVRDGLAAASAFLGDKEWFGGASANALDAYAAAAMGVVATLPHDQCPMSPPMRVAFEWLGRELGDEVPKSLVAHRDRFYATHGGLPLSL